jgi:N-carbamoyl-L-amino-acid hydrolase
VFSGRAAHAGATPMDMRQDSFLAAARAALLIQEVGLAHEGGYCTTGGASSDPGVVTAVAGRTELLLDQRHLDAGELAAMLKEADEACHNAAEEFGCTVEVKHLWSIPPIPFDDRLIGFAKEALGSDIAIPSGPLHDAAEMARVIPTVMLFVKSLRGLSHTKEEDTPVEDLELSVRALDELTRRALAWAA